MKRPKGMRVTKSYSEEFKQEAVKKLLTSKVEGLSDIARKIDVPPSTLFCWKQNYANKIVMKKANNTKSWTAEEKLEILIKTAAMSETELGEYLRANGFHSEDLKRFREEIIEKTKGRGRLETDLEVGKLKSENKKLEREIKRKDKALAEYGARVILLKKSHEIWGAGEDDE